jgi:hypothetical protein
VPKPRAKQDPNDQALSAIQKLAEQEPKLDPNADTKSSTGAGRREYEKAQLANDAFTRIATLPKGTMIKIRGIPMILHEDALIKTTDENQALLCSQFTALSEKPYAAHVPGTSSATRSRSLL